MSIGDVVPWHWGKKQVPTRQTRAGRPLLLTNLFDDFFNDMPFSKLMEDGESFIPKVNVKDTDEAIMVSAEIPGVEKDQLEITLNDDTLVLSGEKKHSHEESEKDGHHYVERSYGMFRRVIPLNVAIDEDNVDAKFKNGVVTIKLPKSSDQKGTQKKITLR